MATLAVIMQMQRATAPESNEKTKIVQQSSFLQLYPESCHSLQNIKFGRGVSHRSTRGVRKTFPVTWLLAINKLFYFLPTS
jgi:hypothetical protein